MFWCVQTFLFLPLYWNAMAFLRQLGIFVVLCGKSTSLWLILPTFHLFIYLFRLFILLYLLLKERFTLNCSSCEPLCKLSLPWKTWSLQCKTFLLSDFNRFLKSISFQLCFFGLYMSTCLWPKEQSNPHHLMSGTASLMNMREITEYSDKICANRSF